MNRRKFLSNISKGIAIVFGAIAFKSSKTVSGAVQDLDTSQFFSILESGAEGGVLGTDRIGDAVKGVDFYKDFEPDVGVQWNNAEGVLEVGPLGGMETIIKSDEGKYITVSGIVHDLDTSEWDLGTKLWTNDNQGNWTDIKPLDPSLIATVIESHANKGSIFVSPYHP